MTDEPIQTRAEPRKRGHPTKAQMLRKQMLLKLSYGYLHKVLSSEDDDPRFTVQDKLSVAKMMVAKDMPTKVDQTVNKRVTHDLAKAARLAAERIRAERIGDRAKVTIDVPVKRGPQRGKYWGHQQRGWSDSLKTLRGNTDGEERIDSEKEPEREEVCSE